MKHLEELLIPAARDEGNRFWRGTVHTTDPLRIERVEGIMDATPENYAGPLTVGQRVLGVTIGSAPVIIGKGNQ